MNNVINVKVSLVLQMLNDSSSLRPIKNKILDYIANYLL
jgi:hypothetical protein